MNNPLWMPEGSVRALLVIMLTWTACWLLSTQIPVPKELWALLSAGIGFYTGMKVGQKKEETK